MSGLHLCAEGLRFAYAEGDFRLEVERVELAAGEAVACVGASGSGKTTLVHLLTGVLSPTAGRVVLDGKELSSMSEQERRELRLESVGMVFQHFALLDYLSVLDNILLPYHVSSRLHLDSPARARARELAASVGIEDLLGRKPGSLSQGERQRVALCRALVTSPALVVADEPTGNLDPRRARSAVELLLSRCRDRGAALLVVTHDHGLLDLFDRTLAMDEIASPA